MDALNNKIISSNKIILGFFLINWSYVSFFLGGNNLKVLLLLIGFIFYTFFFFQNKIKKNAHFFKISILVVTYYLILVLYSNLMFHNINQLLIIFGFINCILFLGGYLISINSYNFRMPTKGLVVFLVFFSIIGIISYFLFGNLLLTEENYDSLMQYKENGINRIGVGYTALIIFFIFYNLLKSNHYGKYLIILMYSVLFLLIIQILHLQARGVILFMLLILFIDNFQLIFKINKLLKKIVSLFILISILFFLISFYFPQYFDVLEGTIERFSGIIGFFDENKQIDRSAFERTKLIDFFFDNYNEFIFTGLRDYSPYPHNIFIEIIERFGIILGFPILFSILYTSYKAFKIVYNNEKDNVLINIFSMIYLYTFFQAFTSFNLENNRALWVSMGVILFFNYKKNKVLKHI
ncbi:hypothetical protein OBJ68_06520 [Empedobacter falsenii]